MDRATVGETGPEKPDVLIVPGARIYDLVPVRELPIRLQLHRCIRGRTDGSFNYVPIFFLKPLALGGASTDENTA